MSHSGTYLRQNPFPYLGTFTIAGERREATVRAERWLPRPHIKLLGKAVDGYLDEFQPGWTAQGRIIVIRGPHGSGKTHTIYAALHSDTQTKEKQEPIFFLYTLQQDEDFFACYRQVIAHMNKEPGLWRQLARTLLATMAGEQLEADLGADPNELAESLRRQPEKADRLFDTYTVSRSVATSRQERALLDLTPGAFNKNLKAAIDALQGDKFNPAAVRWFSLEPVTADELAAMGISGSISTGDEALSAILLLCALLTNAGRRTVFVIDQFEKLLVPTDPMVTRRNVGFLRSLVEGFRRRNVLFVVSGTDEGWNSLADDLKSRMGQDVIDCPLLKLEEARDLLRLYLTPAGEKFKPGEGPFHPFTDAAVKAMLTLSSGNPRRFLQLCHEAMRTPASVIDHDLVRQIAESGSQQYFNRAMVLAHTRQILGLQRLRFREDFSIAGFSFDFALLDASDDAALYINVTEAIFLDDEAENAHASAASLARMRRAGIASPLLVVATGYVSPDVVEHLSTVVHKLIVYAPGSFEREFRELLDDLKRNAALVAKKPELDNHQLAQKVDQLLRLSEERGTQSHVFEQRNVDLSESQTRLRQQERYERVRSEWSAIRRGLLQQIQTARKSRRDDAISRVNQQIDLSRWMWIARDLSALVLLSALSIAWFRTSVNPKLLAFVLTAGCVGYLDCMVGFAVSGAWSHVKSQRDLARFHGNSFAAAFGAFHWANPIFRLVLYRQGRRSVATEKLPAIREAALKTFAGKSDARIWAVPESLILVERRREIEGVPPAELRTPMAILVALRKHGDGSSSFAAALAFSVYNREGVLYQLFNEGFESIAVAHVKVAERQLREAVRALSPFDEDGLGTFDFLDSIATIDEMFLFCSQYLFYSEQKILPGSVKVNKGQGDAS